MAYGKFGQLVVDLHLDPSLRMRFRLCAHEVLADRNVIDDAQVMALVQRDGSRIDNAFIAENPGTGDNPDHVRGSALVASLNDVRP